MIVSASAPTRISLICGGQDLDPYASLYGGCAINMAVNIRHHMILKTDKDSDNKTYFDIPSGANKNFYLKILDEYNVSLKNTTLFNTFDGRIESGLGSSSSAIVTLIGCLRKLLGKTQNRQEIAEEAHRIEKERLGIYCGKQDHYAATYGGFNFMAFGKETFITPMKSYYQEDIIQSIVLFDTGLKRQSHTIQDNLKELTPQKKDLLDQLKEIAYGSVDYINQGRISQLAASITHSWILKKRLNSVSNDIIDEAIRLGRESGALAGKLLGAGEGGYIMFIVEPQRKRVFLDNMRKYKLKHIDFSLDKNGLEVKAIS